MALVPCPLAHDLHLVIRPRRFEEAARRYPDVIPPNFKQVIADLKALAAAGVPALLEEDRDGEFTVRFCTARYELATALTAREDGYFVRYLAPLSLRTHDQIARHAVAVMPRGWVIHVDVETLHQEGFVDNGLGLIQQAWDQAEAATGRPMRPHIGMTPAQVTFLAEVDDLVDLARDLELESVANQARTPVTRAERVSRPHTTGDVYRLHLRTSSPFAPGDFVWAALDSDGGSGPGYVGSVLETAAKSLVLRFHRPVADAEARALAWLRPWVSTKQYDIQHDAVRALREGRALNPNLLPLLVEGVFQDPGFAQPGPNQPPATDLPEADQLNAAQSTLLEQAAEVPDLLLALGPPGTGKTHTIRAIVRQQAGAGQRILVTSKNNKAVDNVLAALTGVDALRIGREEAVSSDVRPMMIDARAQVMQAEILERIAPRWQAAQHESGAWGAVQQTLDALAGQLEAGQRALEGAGEARAALRRWQQARYWDVEPAIQRQLRRFADAHALALKTARRANGLRTRMDRLAALAALPLIGPFCALAWARVGQAQREAVVRHREALRTCEAAAEAAHDLWATYHHTATASDEALARQQAVRDAEIARTQQHAQLAELCAQLQAQLAPLANVPAVPDARTLLRAPEVLPVLRQALRDRLAHQEEQQRALLNDWHALIAGHPHVLYSTLIQQADVVGATCIGVATDARFEDLAFDLAIADEAGQIQVMDLLVPLVRARRAVLVGDHRQLPPIVESELLARLGPDDGDLRRWLEESLFERLFDRASTPESRQVMLDTQYRMPRLIADFISAHFYDDRYRTGREAPHADPFFDTPLVFIDTQHERNHEERPAREPEGIRGYTNDLEARVIADLVVDYEAQGLEWGVIVPYKKQAAHIRRILRKRRGAPSPDTLRDWVSTVDAFQGKERDVIIYGFTRSNRAGRVGFLAELRRLNVSLTRAREQLVLVGDARTLTRAADPAFARLAADLLETVRQTPGGYVEVRDVQRQRRA